MESEVDAFARSRLGNVIQKKYRLERLIGVGGMASVYESVHRNGNRVAIKMLHSQLSIDVDLRTRFLREGYVANKVNHRGAVRVLDDDIAEDGSVFLVMELLEGETLAERRRRAGDRMPDPEVCAFAHQLLEVLAAAHDNGVVHRDIKPDNLFVTNEGILKVLDFGIARLREASGPNRQTLTGRMIGTPAFMPPEQALGRATQIDGQTDLWAVGATMFTLLSGHFVHEAETTEEMLVRSGSQVARRVMTVRPDLPVLLAGVVDRALAFKKNERWVDARAMSGALADACRAAYGVPIPALGVPGRPGESLPFARTELTTTPRTDNPWDAAQGTLDAERALGGPSAVSTTAGIAGNGASRRQSRAPRGAGQGTGVWIAAAAVVAAMLAGGLFAVGRHTANAVPDATPPTTITAVSPTVPTLDVTAQVPSPPPSSPPVAAIPTVLYEPPAASAPRALSPGTPKPPRAASTVVIAPTVPMSTGKPDCDPPYFVDSVGHRRYKPECLN